MYYVLCPHIAHRRLLAANFVCNPGKLIWGYRDSLGVPTQHFLSDPLDSFRQKVSMIKLPSLDNFSLAYMPFILRMEVESCLDDTRVRLKEC